VSWILCDCGRGEYEEEEYSSCYACYQDRLEDYDQCIWCSRWHSPRYSTCFQCRAQYGRDEAGQALKLAILMRDDFMCQQLGCGSRHRPEVDHIFPCFEGGTADVWNLQVLCHDHNKMKGRTWYYRSSHWDRRVALMHRYFTYWWDWIDDEDRQLLVTDACGPLYAGHFESRTRLRQRLGQPVGSWPDEQDSHALAARLGVDHDHAGHGA
jgi:hypothetical protein